MRKALVLYYSKYGTTKKYAEWIASELRGGAYEVCDIYALADYKTENLASYDALVIGSGLYAGNIRGIDIIVKNFDIIQGKKIVLFTCGLSDYSKQENIKAINTRIEAAIPEKIRKNVRTFLLRGGMDYKNLGFLDRILMALMKKSVEGKIKKEAEGISDETREFLETYGKTVDFMDKENIRGIVEYCMN